MNENSSRDLSPIIPIEADEDAKLWRSGTPHWLPVLGAWYWVKETPEWLGCIMHIGSNYVEIQSPHASSSGYRYCRVHFDDFAEKLRHEPHAPERIRANIAMHQRESNRLMAEIQSVTQSLGMTPQNRLEGPSVQAEQASGALRVLSSQDDPKAYGSALELAKNVTLPALFESLKKSNASLAAWMHAPIMETLALMADQNELVKDINNRIFSVELYAGLTETTVQVSEGAPAALTDKLHVMQRMAFMDEECLANYKVGGMDIQDLDDFDAWLTQPENRDRVLPFPRTLVAMRIRRNVKERDWKGSINQLRINIQLEQSDKMTFLYIRNGDQLWRLNTAIDFGELIFPDASVFDPSEPKMAEMFGESIKGFVSQHWWEEERDRQIESKKKHDEWEKAHKGAEQPGVFNPHRTWFSSPYDRYEPVDPSSVYYDDSMAALDKEMQRYNRVALIIQGLFDRSMVLHPHLPARTWDAHGFEAAVHLVYDGTSVLHYGEAPDFEAYRARCNASLGANSTTIGQDDFWMRREAERESARLDRDYRNKSEYRPDRFRPEGNPGPGYFATAVKWSKKNGATFQWQRHRMGEVDFWKNKSSMIDCSITVPVSELFNVDAYVPGDFRQFFSDPRTRAQYLRWAPMLIAAEEYHAKLNSSTQKAAT